MQKTVKEKTIKLFTHGEKYDLFIRIGFIALILRFTFGVFVTEAGFALSGIGIVPVVLKGLNLLQNALILLAVPFCIIKRPKRCIVFTAVFVFVMLASILVFPETFPLIRHEARSMFVGLYIPAVICMSIDFDKRLWKDLKMCGYTATVMSLAMTLVYVLHKNSLYGTADYDMSYSYAVIVPALILLATFFAEGKLVNLLMSLVLVAAIIKYGARGPFICYCVSGALLLVSSLLLKLKKKDINTEKTAKHNFAFAVCIAFIAVCIILAGFSFLKENSIKTGIRFIDAFSTKQADSGRAEFHYKPAVSHILDESVFAGDGLFSDRPYLYKNIMREFAARIKTSDALYGCYCHNIVLELMFQFGLIVGALLFSGLMWLIIRAYRCSGSAAWVLCIFIGLSSALFVSSSYLTFAGLWVLIGFCINILCKGGIME